jgi:(p)ppGpp synthase/HD superfamily hydrolase
MTPDVMGDAMHQEAKGSSFCIFCGNRSGNHHLFCRSRDAAEKNGVKSLLDSNQIISKVQGEFPMSIDGLIMRSAKVASEAHKDQVRKYSESPYIYHPMRVAGRVTLLMGSTPIEVSSAWLHDVMEDSKMSREDLLDRGIPQAVIENVMSLSNPSRFHKEKARAERKLMDREWLSSQSIWVKKIKMADRIDNLFELSFEDAKFMALYVKESELLAEAIGSADVNLKEEILALTKYYVSELERVAREAV